MNRTSAILFFLALCSQASAQITNQNLFDTIPFLVDHYRARVKAFESEPVETGKIIFLGNSITEGGDWKALTGISSVINRGIGGDVTFGVLQRLADITRRQPSKLFILIGINDIGKDIPDAVIADNVRKIILTVQRASPVTTIFLQSILPVNPAIHKFPQHYDKQYHVIHTNSLLEQVAATTGIRYLNIYPLFLDSMQRLDQRFTSDGLHLNQEGYKTWVKFLKETDCL